MTARKPNCSICRDYYDMIKTYGCNCTQCHCHQQMEIGEGPVCWSCSQGSHKQIGDWTVHYKVAKTAGYFKLARLFHKIRSIIHV